ncbi:MAG: hypothetical protein WC860_08665, partial [Candidatus Margulisiibacteriota bacterium]
GLDFFKYIEAHYLPKILTTACTENEREFIAKARCLSNSYLINGLTKNKNPQTNPAFILFLDGEMKNIYTNPDIISPKEKEVMAKSRHISYKLVMEAISKLNPPDIKLTLSLLEDTIKDETHIFDFKFSNPQEQQKMQNNKIYIYNIFLKCLSKVNPPEERIALKIADLIFQENQIFKGFSQNHLTRFAIDRAYNFLDQLKILLDAKKITPDLAEKLIHYIKANNIFSPAKTTPELSQKMAVLAADFYSYLIQGTAALNLGYAQQLLEKCTHPVKIFRINHSNTDSGIYAYKSIFIRLIESGNLAEALKFLKQAETENVFDNSLDECQIIHAYCYQELIKAFLKISNRTEAKILINQFKLISNQLRYNRTHLNALQQFYLNTTMKIELEGLEKQRLEEAKIATPPDPNFEEVKQKISQELQPIFSTTEEEIETKKLQGSIQIPMQVLASSSTGAASTEKPKNEVSQSVMLPKTSAESSSSATPKAPTQIGLENQSPLKPFTAPEIKLIEQEIESHELDLESDTLSLDESEAAEEKPAVEINPLELEQKNVLSLKFQFERENIKKAQKILKYPEELVSGRIKKVYNDLYQKPLSEAKAKELTQEIIEELSQAQPQQNRAALLGTYTEYFYKLIKAYNENKDPRIKALMNKILSEIHAEINADIYQKLELIDNKKAEINQILAPVFLKIIGDQESKNAEITAQFLNLLFNKLFPQEPPSENNIANLIKIVKKLKEQNLSVKDLILRNMPDLTFIYKFNRSSLESLLTPEEQRVMNEGITKRKVLNETRSTLLKQAESNPRRLISMYIIKLFVTGSRNLEMCDMALLALINEKAIDLFNSSGAKITTFNENPSILEPYFKMILNQEEQKKFMEFQAAK